MSQKVELLIFDDYKYRIEMSQEQFAAINAAAAYTLGSSMCEIASTQPEAAYQYLKRVMGSIAAHGVTSVWLNDELLSSSSVDGEADTSSTARDIILDRLPNERFETFLITVGVYPNQEDLLFLGKESTIEVCDISISPESLAA